MLPLTAATKRQAPGRSAAAYGGAVAALAVTLAFVVCLSSAPVPVRAVQPLEICVGVVLPLTGPRNVEVLRLLETVKMAAEDITNDPNWMPGTYLHVITDPVLIDSNGFLPYVGKRMFYQVTQAKCENGTGPIAIVGDLEDQLVKEQSSIATLVDTPVLSPGTRDPQFSLDYVDNPYIVVMRPSTHDEAKALLSIFHQMRWTQVVLWHSNSQFGTALTDTLAGSGLEMLDVPIPADDQGIEIKNAITRITTLRFRVIVIHAEPELARLMMNLSYRAGMLNGDYLFFGTSTWTYGTDASGPAVFNEQEKEYLQGVVGTGMLIPTAGAAAFSARLAKRTPKLYPPNFEEGPMATRVAAYNSMKSIALAVKNLTAAGLPYTGETLMNALIGPAMDYKSITGERVQMNDIIGNIVSTYSITNFQGGRFVPIGEWSQARGLLFDSPIIWPGFNEEAVPSQLVPRRTLVVADALPMVAVALGILYGLVSALLHYLIYLNTNHEVIKASSPIFCHIILVGGEVSYLMSGLSALGQEQTCILVPAMISICFSLVFGALVAKTYRIHRIFNSAELRIKTPTNTHLFVICGVLVAYDLFIILLWSTTDVPHAAFVNSPNDPTTAYCTCVMKNATSWAMALFLPKAALVVYGAYLAYKVKDLNHNFNEAKYISLALYNVLLLASLCYGLVSAFPYGVDVVYALKTFGSATVAFITMLILFAPKFWDVYITKDWIDYHSHSSYISGVLVHKSSKGSYAKAIAKATGNSVNAPGGGGDEKEGTATAGGKPTVAVGSLTGAGAATAGSRRTPSGGAPAGNKGHHHHAHSSGNKKDQYVYVSDRSKPAPGGGGRNSPVGPTKRSLTSGKEPAPMSSSPLSGAMTTTTTTTARKGSAGSSLDGSSKPLPLPNAGAPATPSMAGSVGGGGGGSGGTPIMAARQSTVSTLPSTGSGARAVGFSGVGGGGASEGVVTLNIGVAGGVGAASVAATPLPPPLGVGERQHSSRSPSASPATGLAPLPMAIISPKATKSSSADSTTSVGAVVGSAVAVAPLAAPAAAPSQFEGYRIVSPPYAHVPVPLPMPLHGMVGLQMTALGSSSSSAAAAAAAGAAPSAGAVSPNAAGSSAFSSLAIAPPPAAVDTSAASAAMGGGGTPNSVSTNSQSSNSNSNSQINSNRDRAPIAVHTPLAL